MFNVECEFELMADGKWTFCWHFSFVFSTVGKCLSSSVNGTQKLVPTAQCPSHGGHIRLVDLRSFLEKRLFSLTKRNTLLMQLFINISFCFSLIFLIFPFDNDCINASRSTMDFCSDNGPQRNDENQKFLSANLLNFLI
jgi:hypothetical protein